jgi:hypothetical protein
MVCGPIGRRGVSAPASPRERGRRPAPAGLDASHLSRDQKLLAAGGRCKRPGWAQVREWPLNCDVTRNQGPRPEPGQGYGAIPWPGSGGHGAKSCGSKGFPCTMSPGGDSPHLRYKIAVALACHNPVKTGISRSLADSQLRSSGRVKARRAPILKRSARILRWYGNEPRWWRGVPAVRD